MDLDLTPKEETYRIGGRDYTLVEPSEDAACRWRNLATSKAKMQDGKVVGMDGIADVQPYLVSLCLFEETDKGRVAVPLSVIRGWPARVVKVLFERAKELGDLDERGESAKN